MEKAQENLSRGHLRTLGTMYVLSSFSSTAPVIYAMQLKGLTSIPWPNSSSLLLISFVIHDTSHKAQTQLDGDRFGLDKIKKWPIE